MCAYGDLVFEDLLPLLQFSPHHCFLFLLHSQLQGGGREGGGGEEGGRDSGREGRGKKELREKATSRLHMYIRMHVVHVYLNIHQRATTREVGEGGGDI